MTYDKWKSTPPPDSGEPPIDEEDEDMGTNGVALSTSETDGEFSVFWWDPSGHYHLEKQFCGAQEAVETARSLTMRPAALLGIIRRIVITDGGDCTNFVWEFEKGITYPDGAVQ